ncbi:DUF6924 domain-containing protein [Amycolatopsis pigmentata]|uniref:DUF6924 domain-containing protein n=1 Tax=Amycolatopsis pigmentata TaxID=450801 RepID=A0ABW5FSC7_9PSEU
MTALRSAVLVRTWFGDDGAWESLLREARTPSEDGFLANVTPVDDPEWEGLGIEALKAKQTVGPFVSFLADETTLTSAEHPILAVWVFSRHDGDQREHQPFRVVPSALWSVENNINLANMDWADFTSSVGEDGIFRGF